MNSLFNHWEKSDQNVMQYICNDVINTELDIKNKKESNDFCGVIIDGRDRNWNTIEDYCAIKSFKLFSEYNYPIFVFLHNNANFLNNEFSLLDSWRLNLIEISQLNSLDKYTNFMIKELFFRIPEKFENILIFQSDSGLIKSGWEKFILDNKIDLIGAHFQHQPSVEVLYNNQWQNILNFRTQFCNGGFTFRKASLCRKVSKEFGFLNHREFSAPNNKKCQEDLWFSYFLYGIGLAKIPTLEQACFFSRDPIDLNTYLNKKSYGFHRPVGINKFLCTQH